MTEREQPNLYEGITCVPFGGGRGNALFYVASLTDNRSKANAKADLMSKMSGYAIRESYYEGVRILIAAHGDLDVFINPEESRSKHMGSEAEYLARSSDDKLHLKGMKSYTKSSSHQHDGPEYYWQLYGESYVRTPDREIAINADSPCATIPPHTKHQVFVENGPYIAALKCDFTTHIYSS